jgi:BASS family bile acid:Na+ symporter
MNLIIVLPILTLLMFQLGLTLCPSDFLLFRDRPRPIWVGLAGQLVALPLLAFCIGALFHLPAYYFLGILLIACSPGGSSSNIFSMLAGGDVALSVSLTALSSVLTLVTLPLWMQLGVTFSSLQLTAESAAEGTAYAAVSLTHLPVGNMLVQNLVTMLLPIGVGIWVRRKHPVVAGRCQRVLSRCAFPALIFLAAVFFVLHRDLIAAYLPTLGGSILCLLLLSMFVGWRWAKFARLTARETKTLIIEIGMQNAAQAIALASSPFVFNDSRMAIPAIIYALLMNVVLLIYVGLVKRKRTA